MAEKRQSESIEDWAADVDYGDDDGNNDSDPYADVNYGDDKRDKANYGKTHFKHQKYLFVFFG